MKKRANDKDKDKDKEKGEKQEAENEMSPRRSTLKGLQDKGVTYLGTGTLFGELSNVRQKKWRHAFIFALEPSLVIEFPNNQINRIINVPSL